MSVHTHTDGSSKYIFNNLIVNFVALLIIFLMSLSMFLSFFTLGTHVGCYLG